MSEKLFEIDVIEDAYATYTVYAESAEEARAKLERGEWDGFKDLGHENMEIGEVREV